VDKVEKVEIVENFENVEIVEKVEDAAPLDNGAPSVRVDDVGSCSPGTPIAKKLF
jgi:hypothetical protein